jgi:hypothetical protein
LLYISYSSALLSPVLVVVVGEDLLAIAAAEQEDESVQVAAQVIATHLTRHPPCQKTARTNFRFGKVPSSQTRVDDIMAGRRAVINRASRSWLLHGSPRLWSNAPAADPYIYTSALRVEVVCICRESSADPGRDDEKGAGRVVQRGPATAGCGRHAAGPDCHRLSRKICA